MKKFKTVFQAGYVSENGWIACGYGANLAEAKADLLEQIKRLQKSDLPTHTLAEVLNLLSQVHYYKEQTFQDEIE